MPANTLILLAASLGATPAAPTCTPPTYAQVSPPKYPPSAVAERLEGTAVLRMLEHIRPSLSSERRSAVVRTVVDDKHSRRLRPKGASLLDDGGDALASAVGRDDGTGTHAEVDTTTALRRGVILQKMPGTWA